MAVSINPKSFVEGGAVPVDKNLVWKKCRFAMFDYINKAGETVATTVAAQITYQDDDGNETVQHYSAGDPKRFQPSADGKTLEGDGALSKSSNYYLLMNALLNAGFPENRFGEDISVLDGLYTHNIGLPEPKRTGLVREQVDGARERVISVPDQILKLPWEGKPAAKGKAAPAAKTNATTVPAEDEGDAVADALALVTEMVANAESGSVKRQQVAATAIRSRKQAVAGLVFKPEFKAALEDAGFVVDGEDISMAG